MELENTVNLGWQDSKLVSNPKDIFLLSLSSSFLACIVVYFHVVVLLALFCLFFWIIIYRRVWMGYND